MKKPDEELIIDGKPMWDWAQDNGWVQIGCWQCDPQHLSLKWINETIEWEIRNAKREAIQELRDLINERGPSNTMSVIPADGTVYLDAKWILGAIDSLLEEYKEPKGQLPASPEKEPDAD